MRMFREIVTMKKIIPLIFIFFLTVTSYAQNKTLGVGIPTPNANAALHVESPTNNQGFIMPRLTTSQRTSMGPLLTTTDNGLMLYDTDLKTIYVWDGATWKSTAQVAGGSKLSYPYEDIVTTNTGTTDVFALKYNATDNTRVMRIENQSATNGSSALSVSNLGVGLAGYFQVTNATSGGTALYGTTNSNLGGAVAPVGVYGESTGTGSLAGSFRVANVANAFPALYAETNGTGNVLNLNQINAGNTTAVVNIANAGTGNAIQTTGKISAGQFIGDGSALTGVISAPFTFPFNTPVSTATTSFDILNTGAGGAGKFTVNNAANTNPALNVETNGLSFGIRSYSTGAENAGYFEINNAVTVNSALAAITNGTANAVVGVNTGTGRAATFDITNIANSQATLDVRTLGTGKAGTFEINNVTSGSTGVYASTNGAGYAIAARAFGSGSAGFFRKDGATANSAAVWGDNYGTAGYAAIFQNIDASNTTAALFAEAVGTGASVWANKATGESGNSLIARHDGTSGNAARFQITLATNASAAINATTVGTNAAGNFTITNVANTAAAVNARTDGTGSAVNGSNTGAGNGFGGTFSTTNAANTYPAIQASTEGTGTGVRVIQNATSIGGGMDVIMQNTTGSALGFSVDQQGLGSAGNFNVNNASNNQPAVFASSNGTGGAITAESTGNSSALYAHTTIGAVGDAIVAQNDGPNRWAIWAETTNPAHSIGTLMARTAGTGTVAFFSINNPASSAASVNATTMGTGAALIASHQGASGNVAIFESGSSPVNVARIDKTGRGFFNGGTQASGADVAEMFDVEGARESYEPGDVLVISEATDRTVEKSSSASSTKVVGVYATKPGVVLTEKGIDENLDQLVPMGVIGVIPTKVCNENGPIKRGDLLVTSSKSGHAMKAISVKGDGVFPSGVIIGKALENFENGESDLIKVLVNVK